MINDLITSFPHGFYRPQSGRTFALLPGVQTVEVAVRKTGLLTAGRNPGDRTGPACQLLTTDCNNATSEGQIPTARRTVA